MIISFAHKFAFVAVPKTGSQAVRQFLRPFLQVGDWEQSVFDTPRFFPVPRLARIGHGHLKISEVQPFLLPGMWRDFYSFAIIRNPFDRFLSFCNFFYPDEMARTDDPIALMKKIIGDPKGRHHVLMQPQHRFLEDENGDLAVSFVGRYEHLQRDIKTICERLDLPFIELERINASDRMPLTRSFDRELEEMVIDNYRLDFENFGYDPTLPPGI